MRDRLKAAAEKNNRSMNAEIVSRLEASENVGKFLEEFQILKNTNYHQSQQIKDLGRASDNAFAAAKTAQQISRQLIELLMTRLNVGESDIVAITGPRDNSE